MSYINRLTLVAVCTLLNACQTVNHPKPLPMLDANPPKCMNIDELFCQNHWWYVFGDEGLNALMSQVVHNNHELSVATLTLQKSLIDVKKHQDSKKIVTSGQFNSSHQQKKQLHEGTLTSASNFDANLNASWEIDLWGKLQLQHSMSEWGKNAVQADRQAVFLSLTGNAVKEYFALIAINHKIWDNDQNLQFQQNQLQRLQKQLTIGLIAPADLLPIKQTIATLEQTALTLDSQKYQSLNALAILTHMPIDRLPTKIKNQRHLPTLPDIATVMPANVIGNRPDIQALLWRLSVSLQQENLLKQNQYPTLVLNAGANAQHANLFDLLKVPVLNWGISLNIPTFDQKQNQRMQQLANIDGKIATLNYQDAAHKALLDVQAKLFAWQHHKQQHARMLQSHQLAKKQLDYQEKRHKIGLISAKELEESKESFRQSQTTLIDSMYAQANSLVALYQAMGGV